VRAPQPVPDMSLAMHPRADHFRSRAALRIFLFVAVSALLHGAGIALLSPLPRAIFTMPDAGTSRLTVQFLPKPPLNKAATPSLPSETSLRTTTSAVPTASSPAPSPERFHEIRELDTFIRPLNDIQPTYPPNSDPMTSGFIVLDLFIDKTGKVQFVAIDESSLSPEFGEAAIAAFLHQYFEPGKIKNEPVNTHLKVKVEFQTDSKSTP
jgi:TonB family protein